MRGVTVAIISWRPWEIDKSVLRTYLILLWSHVDEWVREEKKSKVHPSSVWWSSAFGRFFLVFYFFIGMCTHEKILEWIASSVCRSLSSKCVCACYTCILLKFCYFESVREWQGKFVCVLFRCKYRVLCQEKWNEAFIVRLTDYRN